MPNGIYHLHVITPLHVGVGQGMGFVDLPIARETATGLPEVRSSGIKGVWRDRWYDSDKEKLFGKEDGGTGGALQFGDARLLCLPVRSYNGIFAWVSCPLILLRYARDLRDAGATAQNKLFVPQLDKDEALITSQSVLASMDSKLHLEDLTLPGNMNGDQADSWAEHIAAITFPDDTEWQAIFKTHFAVLPDNYFAYLAEFRTELRPHIALDSNNRTVKQGPWYEESLPAETILWGTVTLSEQDWPPALVNNSRLQIGGGATTGLGQVFWLLNE